MKGASYDEAPRSRRGVPVRGGRAPQHSSYDQMVRIVSVVLGAILLLVVGRLIYLQVADAKYLSAKATAQRTNEITIHAKRGTIYDRNGNVLATSEDCKTIYCNPQEVNDPAEAASVLADELGGEDTDYVDKLMGDNSFTYIKRQVDDDVAKSVQKRLEKKKIRGIYYLDDVKRVYPYGATGGQVLGIVGTDGNGLSGLELYYNDVLEGTDGKMMVETGSGGTPIAGGNSQVVKKARNGKDIVISLDIDVQKIAEDTIVQGVKDYKADSGSAMVTDPKSGEIIAACSTPLFNITDTSQIKEGALNLKPVSSSYEPGSIFKVLTAAIGIDNGLVTPSSTFSVPGKIRVGDDLVGDDDGRTATMNMSLREILRRSSNAGMALVAQDVIGEEKFANGIAKFKIGSKTGIDYPGEVKGIVKQLNQYDGASLGSMSFGQSLAIPLDQMVKAIGSIANDGKIVTPHFLVSRGGKKVAWKTEDRSVSKKTADEVTDMMRTVVKDGTAQAAQVKGYDVAGKTGTGEQADDSGKYVAFKYVSSLIGFANASDPKVLVYVGLNGTPYLATSSAAPLFSTIMSEALSDMGVTPDAG